MIYDYLFAKRSRKRVFISFDYEHDSDLKNLLVGQAKKEDSPFEISDWSVKEELSGNWKEKVRRKIRKVDIIIVICGVYTNIASGVNAEVKIAQEEGKTLFFTLGKVGQTM